MQFKQTDTIDCSTMSINAVANKKWILETFTVRPRHAVKHRTRLKTRIPELAAVPARCCAAYGHAARPTRRGLPGSPTESWARTRCPSRAPCNSTHNATSLTAIRRQRGFSVKDVVKHTFPSTWAAAIHYTGLEGQVWYCQSTKGKVTLWTVDLAEGSNCWNMLWK